MCLSVLGILYREYWHDVINFRVNLSDFAF